MFTITLATMLWFLDVQAMQNNKDLANDLGHRIAGGAFQTQLQCQKEGRDRVSEFNLSGPIELQGKGTIKYTFTCVKKLPPPPKTLQQINEIHDTSHAHNMPGM